MIAIARFEVQLKSMANARLHYLARARENRVHRDIGRLLASQLRRQLRVEHAQRRRVRLVRVGPRALDDDNLAHAFKSVRDGIAELYAIDDGDSRWEWAYAQEKGDYAVRAELEILP